jgi:hypothetical protein
MNLTENENKENSSETSDYDVCENADDSSKNNKALAKRKLKNNHKKSFKQPKFGKKFKSNETKQQRKPTLLQKVIRD